MNGNVRMKVLLVTGLLAALLAVSAMTRLGAVPVARALVVLLAVGGGAAYLWKRRPGSAAVPPSRLRVHARAGLSNKCGVALVEADGQSYLIAFGDGFAQIQPAAGARTPLRRLEPTDALGTLDKEAWS